MIEFKFQALRLPLSDTTNLMYIEDATIDIGRERALPMRRGNEIPDREAPDPSPLA